MTAQDLPLAGRTVLVLRAPERARPLADRLRGLGADVVVAPVTTTAPPESTGPLDAAAAALDSYAWVALTSVNAVSALRAAWERVGARQFVDALTSQDGGLPRPEDMPRFAAVGPATARALRLEGEPVDLEAAGTAADLVQVFPPAPDAASGGSRRVLLPLGDLARSVLADGLRAAGWEVETVVAYRTVPVALPDDVAALARRGGIDVAVVAAGSAARELADQLSDAAPPVVAIGQPSADAARAAGLTVVGIADHPTDEALADAVCAAETTRSEP